MSWRWIDVRRWPGRVRSVSPDMVFKLGRVLHKLITQAREIIDLGQRDRLVTECAQVGDQVDPFGLVRDTRRLHLERPAW